MTSANVKNDETIENWRKRLIFRSNHRGTKEMDLVMGSFAGQNIADFDGKQLQEYEDILSENDPNLYNWITGAEEAPKSMTSLGVFQLLQSHKFV